MGSEIGEGGGGGSLKGGREYGVERRFQRDEENGGKLMLL